MRSKRAASLSESPDSLLRKSKIITAIIPNINIENKNKIELFCIFLYQVLTIGQNNGREFLFLDHKIYYLILTIFIKNRKDKIRHFLN
jgi:hypothetical protein